MLLIGQDKIKQQITEFTSTSSKPHVVSVIGRAGYGKTTVVHYCAEQFGIRRLVEVDSMDTMREAIELAFNAVTPIGIHITAFEKLNFRAKEPLLKFCEETKDNVYVFIEVTNIGLYEERYSNRSQVLYLENYSKQELSEIIDSFDGPISEDDKQLLFSMFGTPKDLISAIEFGIQKTHSTLSTFMNKIFKASFSNSLKSANLISFKEKDGNIDLELFLHGVANLSFRQFVSTREENYFRLMESANKHLSDLRQIKSISKKMLFDRFILDVKEVAE